MLELYANQLVGWKKRTGIKDNGAPIYAPVQNIPARFEYRRRMTRNEHGEDVISEAFVLTKSPVSLGDALIWDEREWPVLFVSVEYGLMGEELHREVRV